ncbi:hypothetical protein NLU13_6547 [Sarocladium strictum]|uniref:Glycosyl transferase n=1 Tax=Sarocladium strictum TaxID=5046 RepID=A0AA39GII7_SARSR|nr:hypothetical protein NLU13_6547 [Sarocladium strictum]
MASFFQPGSNDPAISECPPQRFQVYCNSILPISQRLVSWHQLATLIIGCVAVAVPLTIVIFLWAWRRLSSLSSRQSKRRSGIGLRGKVHNSAPLAIPGGKAIKSFIICDNVDGFMPESLDRDYDLLLLPMTAVDMTPEFDSNVALSLTAPSNLQAQVAVALFDLSLMDLDSLSPSNLSTTVNWILLAKKRNHVVGLALRFTSAHDPDLVNNLISSLYHKGAPVIAICNHDASTWDSISLEVLSGIIIESACILPNGERRDYFKAHRLRQLMARCSEQRVEKPDFFVGFHDTWDRRPHPSIIRRAVKLADHFGAVVEHGPASPEERSNSPLRAASSTLSGFEYLRRGDCAEIQKSWITELRKPLVPTDDRAPEHSSLPLKDLEVVLPQIQRLLLPRALPEALRHVQQERTFPIASPHYANTAPNRGSFWEQTGDGEPLSSRGCFSITTEASSQEYDAVVKVQKHLRDLHMLHVVEGDEAYKHLEGYRRLVKFTECNELVHRLINGLVANQICIYKGLDTGFGVPSREVSFWGVSRSRDAAVATSVDIFVSQKAPDDATTILHTWLAHHGLSRAQRFEIEMQFELANNIPSPDGLPCSIKTAINQASYSEVLALLHQIRVSHMNHTLRAPITAYCRTKLLDEASRLSWNHLQARAALDGSLGMRELLRMRLEHFVRLGARRLPSLDNLMAIYLALERIVEDALFTGDREPLNALVNSLLVAYDPWSSWTHCDHVDINADLFALIFFTVLKRVAFEEVYFEATDRCPFFLPQPDQAAVFSELWVLGSQCEIYFSLLPRDLGQIVYTRYQAFLQDNPPTAGDRKGTEIMTMYSGSDVASPDEEEAETAKDGSSAVRMTSHQRIELWKKRMTEMGAMSIFCLPAVIDVLLLTFVGRGMFMTAFMTPAHLQAASYALLISLLLTAGVTGWVGSTGNFYLAHYAYDNMIYFHVQRLSGGFVLALLVAAGGIVGFSLAYDAAVGFVFAAYVIVITTYLNLLGIMATMHQANSPITSGRTVIWRTMPVILVSPILTTFVSGYDLVIYLPVTYSFLLLLLWQYRRLCHEWSEWMDNIPNFTEKDVLEWHKKKLSSGTDSDDQAENQNKDAQNALHLAVVGFQARSRDAVRNGHMKDPFVAKAAAGMPYVAWLFKKTAPDAKAPEPFSTSYFTQLGEAVKQQRQLSRGLKEHNVLMLFRQAKYDLAQNLGLFLVALMDRWVAIVMAARKPSPTIYTDARSRYGVCFALLYFCFSVMLLDTTLQKYWSVRFEPSTDKLEDLDHARLVAKQSERQRLKKLASATSELLIKIMFVFGLTTLLIWVLVKTPQTTMLYYLYVLGYTGVIVMQFNRCFTTNVRAHVTIIMLSSLAGFVVGITLRALPQTAGWFYADILAQNVASVLAATCTFLWSLRDWSSPSGADINPSTGKSEVEEVLVQRRLCSGTSTGTTVAASRVANIYGTSVCHSHESRLSMNILDLLHNSLSHPSETAKRAAWSEKLVRRALDLWRTDRLLIVVASRDSFHHAGLSDVGSFSRFDNGSLKVTVGFLGQDELRRDSWQSLLATLAAEAVLYHVARAEFNYSHSKALHAEHFLHGTVLISKRLEFELSQEDSRSLDRMCRRTTTLLLKYLCLGTSVDSEWSSLPIVVRENIVARIVGGSLVSTEDWRAWESRTSVGLDTADFHLHLTALIFQKCNESHYSLNEFPNKPLLESSRHVAELSPIVIGNTMPPTRLLQSWFRKALSLSVTCVKWIAIVSGAGSDIERELWYCLRGTFLRSWSLRVILLVWQACRYLKNAWLFTVLIYHRPNLLKTMRLASKGSRRKIVRNSITVELPRRTITGFATDEEDGAMVLSVYDGALKEPPAGKSPMFKAVYEGCRLKGRVDEGTVGTSYQYAEGHRGRWPITKEVMGNSFRTIGFYDKYGRVSRGIITLGVTEFAFRYHFKSAPKGSADVLAADFKLVDSGSDDILSVYWGVPLGHDGSDYDWVPSSRISRIVKVISGKRYVTEAEYPHRRDPVITTFLEEDDGGRTAIARCPRVFDEEALLLARPNNLSFDMDDLLIYHTPLQVKQMRRHAGRKPTFLSNLHPLTWLTWSGKRVYHSVPTWRIRTELWNDWIKSGTLDAVSACWMDEYILRKEPLLRRYWKARDRGQLSRAKKALDDRLDQITSAIEIATEVSEVCLLPIRTADLYAMGLGKDANEVTNRPEDCFSDTKDRISVIFNDIGCWPEAPGGVSNCRRDLVNGHSTIRNHVLAECANDFGIPRFQVEKNVQSIKLLPLWGLDGKTASHGLIDNLLQSQVDEKIRDTDVQRDIVDLFIPLLRDFVKGARTKRYSRDDLIKYSNVMLSMSKYYEHKDYSRTWASKEVEDAWAEAWLIPYNDPNIADPSKCFEIERPSMSDFREALGIYLAYFFIFSVKIPERCPRVFQSTHHGISSLFGMVLKHRRGVTFGIWDHAILWRECCLNISPAQCELPISVQSMILCGIGLATRLAYFHADVIMPCTSLFNPMWEAEIGTDQGKLGSRSAFSRRIDPIVNGISNMDAFTPVDKVRTEKPTVVMLSNVQFIKGVKIAILAADLIVNRFGFKDYQLVVYGAKDRQPSYALEMAKLIVDNNLSENVHLAGFGNPKEVLKDAWLFMNSSISEGLPLAIGEAALAGVPIVATEVGATALVLTDPKDQDQRYGEVVPPNDPVALARAQISMLSMVGPWAKFTETQYTDENTTLPDEITAADVEWLTERMHSKTEDRRKLGLLSREVVLHSFHGNRYLREHEQMYWIQWHQAKMRADAALDVIARRTYKFGSYQPLRYHDPEDQTPREGVDDAESSSGDDSEGKEMAVARVSSQVQFRKWQDFEDEPPAEEESEKPQRRRRRLSKQLPDSRPSTRLSMQATTPHSAV